MLSFSPSTYMLAVAAVPLFLSGEILLVHATLIIA